MGREPNDDFATLALETGKSAPDPFAVIPTRDYRSAMFILVAKRATGLLQMLPRPRQSVNAVLANLGRPGLTALFPHR